MKPFTKLFSSIITSSIWNENDKVRVVWITMLALSDAKGFVCASVGGLAHAARVSKEDCEVALGYLCSPDDDSRSVEFEGRRIECADGGFLILNYQKYRELGRQIDRTEYLAEKKRESRARLKRQQMSTNVHIESTGVNKTSTLPSASASASASASEEEWIKDLSTDKAYQGIDVPREYSKAVRWFKERKRSCTRRAFINWLNRSDRSMNGEVKKPAPIGDAYKPLPPKREPAEEEIKRAKQIARDEIQKLSAQFRPSEQ